MQKKIIFMYAEFLFKGLFQKESSKSFYHRKLDAFTDIAFHLLF